MNPTDQAKFHSPKDLIDALATARDRARVQLRLLSLAAREGKILNSRPGTASAAAE